MVFAFAGPPWNFDIVPCNLLPYISLRINVTLLMIYRKTVKLDAQSNYLHTSRRPQVDRSANLLSTPRQDQRHDIFSGISFCVMAALLITGMESSGLTGLTKSFFSLAFQRKHPY